MKLGQKELQCLAVPASRITIFSIQLGLDLTVELSRKFEFIKTRTVRFTATQQAPKRPNAFMNIDRIKKDIAFRYLDPKSPDYKFVGDVLGSNIYQDVWMALQNLGQMSDLTDANDDVAFFWLVRPVWCKEGFSVQLSTVGRYAVVIDLEKTTESVILGRSILGILKSFNFYIFTRDELCLRVFEKFSQSTIYEWLFSDVSRPPEEVFSENGCVGD